MGSGVDPGPAGTEPPRAPTGQAAGTPRGARQAADHLPYAPVRDPLRRGARRGLLRGALVRHQLVLRESEQQRDGHLPGSGRWLPLVPPPAGRAHRRHHRRRAGPVRLGTAGRGGGDLGGERPDLRRQPGLHPRAPGEPGSDLLLVRHRDSDHDHDEADHHVRPGPVHHQGDLMERRIRRLGIFMVICFVALFIQLNNIQVIKSNSLAANPANPHVIAVARSQPRGDILAADGVTLATSVSTTTGYYKYARVYNKDTAVLFSQIVGYDSLLYGRTGIEDEYNRYLESHTRPAKSIRDLLVNRTTTDNVTLTINTRLQSQVAAAVDATDAYGSAPQAGAVVVNVKSGAIEAMYSNPTFDPTGLVSQSANVERYTWASLTPNSAQSPLVSRTFQYGCLLYT